jgi:ureidoglycolate hydrolase
MNNNLRLKNLTSESFKLYGDIIQFDENVQDRFQVIVDEPQTDGWRIAISRLTRGKIIKLGLHPNTRESFEPMKGISVILVARKETPQQLELFLLDQPICIHKNIWHVTASLSAEAFIKITENSLVESMEHIQETPLDIGMLTSDLLV